MSLIGRVALVTGASRGIGAAAARELARRGARVVVGYATHADGAMALVAAIEAEGGEAHALQADLSEPDAPATLVNDAAERFGTLDILVNAAGVVAPTPVGGMDATAIDRQFAVNVRAVLLASQAAAARMATDQASDQGGRGGVIVNVSSLNGHRPAPGFAVYSATKAAVDAITVAMAVELGARGIRVCAVAPGTTDTDMLRGIMPEGAQQAIEGATALGRLGQPGDIAKVIAFLASDDAGWITGEIVKADGGLRA